MSAENAPQSANTAPAVDVNKGIEAALKGVATLVEGITKSALAANEANQEAADAAIDAQVEKSVKGKGEGRKTFRMALKTAKMSGEEYKAALKAFDDVNGVSLAAEVKVTEAAPVADVTKAAVTEDATTAALAQITALTESIQKAKTLTPSRAEAFQTALATLKGLLDEMIHVPQGTNPAPNTPAISTSLLTGVPVAKALEDLTALVTKALEAQAATAARIETIEKARGTGNALSTDDTKVATTKAKSIWAGAL